MNAMYLLKSDWKKNDEISGIRNLLVSILFEIF